MTPQSPDPNAPEAILPHEWERLRNNEPAAWMSLLAKIMPVAKEQIHGRFGLVDLHGGNPLAAEGAIWSAWPSFQRHILKDGFSGALTVEDLAVQLIRVTHNRLQRERRKQERLRLATDRGARPNPAGLPVLHAVRDPDEPPEEAVSRADLVGALTGVLDELLEQVESPKKREAVGGLWLSSLTKDERMLQTEIAQRLGVSQAAVSRWLGEFQADVRRMLGPGIEG